LSEINVNNNTTVNKRIKYTDNISPQKSETLLFYLILENKFR